ncbi:MAG: hypothetical protein HQL19_08090, partial [Candidatus Omnitrophica bacterium]|nr:hypothetical protein [Candidatus Omnitrophota bacterium]
GLDAHDLVALAYGGTLKGSVTVRFSENAYAANIAANGLDTAELSVLNGQIGAQMAGRVSGTIYISGRAGQLVALKTAWTMPSGGKVNAALLSLLMQYIPMSQERKRIEAIIQAGGKLKAEVFAFSLASDTPTHLSGAVTLKSREANLEVNVTHEVNIDGTWDSLGKYWNTILP